MKDKNVIPLKAWLYAKAKELGVCPKTVARRMKNGQLAGPVIVSRNGVYVDVKADS